MTTYYVDGAVGNDSNAGTSEGAGNAWATIDKAMNTAQTAGDIVYVKASATYDETANIDAAGAYNNYIIYEGYSSTPGDNGKVTWTKSTSGSCLTDTPSATHYAFKNFKFDTTTNNNVNVASRFYFSNCEFTNSSFSGIVCAANVTFLNCIFANNGTWGVNSSNGAKQYAGCLFYGNTNDAIQDTGSGVSIFYRNVFYSSGGANELVDIAADNCVIIGNTFDGEGTNSILLDMNGGHAEMLMDNIFYDATTAYLTTETSLVTVFNGLIGNNLINSCTNGYYNGSTALTHFNYGVNDVTGAPAFTDEAGDDYTLGASSAAIDAGVNPGGMT